MDWPDRRLADLLGVEHPIIQAPMAGCCTPELAAAVGRAGALGSLGVGPRPEAFVRERVAALRALCERPFNLNFFTHAAPEGAAAEAPARAALAGAYGAAGLPMPEDVATEGTEGFGPERLALVLELKPPVVTFHFGLPAQETLAALRAAGLRVGATATSVAEARAVEAAGCDFVIAQGFEAGGHRGSARPAAPDEAVGTLALVPQVVDAVRLPVVAAGGVTDARGIVAALALGAAGVQMGTAFLRCPEAETPAAARARLAAATDTDTVVTPLVSGRANRVAGRAWRALGPAPHLPFPLQYGLSAGLVAEGGEGFAAVQYGQAAALAAEEGAEALVGRFVAETGALASRLGAGGRS